MPDSYKDEPKPVFKSTTSQFMTTTYPIGYDAMNQQGEQYHDETKLGLSWDEVEKLFLTLQVSPLIETQFVGMTLPDKPTSPKQRYFFTDNGKALLANVTRNSNTSDLVEKVNHMIEKLNEEVKHL